MSAIEAVVFDLDGVLVDSEHVWDEVREELARERGGRWHERAQADMMGMSSTEWSRYMHDVVGLSASPEEINDEVVQRMRARYTDDLPLVDGAVEAVERLAGSFRLALASSSNRPLIDVVLVEAGLERFFEATVSSEEVARGKPSPDVFGFAAEQCAAIEDSGNGLRAAHAAGMRVIAFPNRRYPPPAEALALANVRSIRWSISLPRSWKAREPARGEHKRCALRGPSRSRARRRPAPRVPRSGRSRGRTPDPGCGS